MNSTSSMQPAAKESLHTHEDEKRTCVFLCLACCRPSIPNGFPAKKVCYRTICFELSSPTWFWPIQPNMVLGYSAQHGFGLSSPTWFWAIQPNMVLGFPAQHGFGLSSPTWFWAIQPNMVLGFPAQHGFGPSSPTWLWAIQPNMVLGYPAQHGFGFSRPTWFWAIQPIMVRAFQPNIMLRFSASQFQQAQVFFLQPWFCWPLGLFLFQLHVLLCPGSTQAFTTLQLLHDALG